MADMNLKVKIIPDLSKLKSSLKNFSMNLTGKGTGKNTQEKKRNSERKKESKGILNKLGGMFKLLGIIAIAGSLVAGIMKFVEPIFKIIGVIMTLLFLPLIPILKPAMKAMANMAKKLLPIMSKIKDKVAAAFETGGFGGAIAVLIEEMVDFFVGMAPKISKVIVAVFKGLAKLITEVMPIIITGFNTFMDELIKSGVIDDIANALVDIILALVEFLPAIVGAFVKVIEKLIESDFFEKLIDVFVKVIDALIPLIGPIVDAFVKLVWAITKALIKKIIGAPSLAQVIRGGPRIKRDKSNINEFGGAEGGFIGPIQNDFLMRPGQSPVSFSPNDTIIGVKDPSKLMGGGSITININNPVVRKDSDIRKIADMVSKVMSQQQTRRFSGR